MLETRRLIIRDFALKDIDDLYEILGDEETTKSLEVAYDYKKTQDFLENFCIGKRGVVSVVHKEDNKAIDYLFFNPIEKSIYEIGWVFNRKYWRKGYAYETTSRLIRYGLNEMGIHKIVAETIDNQKSVGLMEKLGHDHEKEEFREFRNKHPEISFTDCKKAFDEEFPSY